eukprot:4595775-Pleurochrysis_carterae.AAC.3
MRPAGTEFSQVYSGLFDHASPFSVRCSVECVHTCPRPCAWAALPGGCRRAAVPYFAATAVAVMLDPPPADVRLVHLSLTNDDARARRGAAIRCTSAFSFSDIPPHITRSNWSIRYFPRSQCNVVARDTSTPMVTR